MTRPYAGTCLAHDAILVRLTDKGRCPLCDAISALRAVQPDAEVVVLVADTEDERDEASWLFDLSDEDVIDDDAMTADEYLDATMWAFGPGGEA